jgi:aspartate-semialdehyde dehydrogenase
MNELLTNTNAKFGPGFSKKTKEESVFEYEIAFNCIPKIGSFSPETGYTSEEIKIAQEPAKILANMPIFNELQISATCVRVPVFVGHCLSVNIEFENLDPEMEFNLPEIEEIIDSSDWLELYNNDSGHVITPQDCVKRDETFVCRLRLDKSVKNGINVFLVCDNLHKGGALNAVQIAEKLII